MYIANRLHKPKQHLRAVLLSLIFVGALGYSSFVIWEQIKPETKIGATPPATVRQVLGDEAKSKPVSAGPVSFEVPKDWEAYKNPDMPNHVHSWRNTADNKGVKTIDLYIGATPDQLAVNRVLAVEPAGNHLLTKGNVSDNCTNFVTTGREVTGGGKQPARWEGVSFICDTGNYNRNVVGISSPAGVNSVRLTGPSGAVNLFMTYTDATLSPTHNIITHAAETLRVK